MRTRLLPALFLSILPLSICTPASSQATSPAPANFADTPLSETAAELLAAIPWVHRGGPDASGMCVLI